MNRLEKCIELINKIEDEELLNQINKLLDNISNMPINKQTEIINQMTNLIKKEGETKWVIQLPKKK